MSYHGKGGQKLASLAGGEPVINLLPQEYIEKF